MWVFSAEPALRLTTDLVEFCTRHMPRFYPFNIRGIIMREAGASMVQEAGFAFSNAIAYIQSAVDRGLHVDEFGRRISFFFSTGTQIFEEAARYRAARRLWARIMKDRFGAEKPDSMLFRSRCYLSALQCIAESRIRAIPRPIRVRRPAESSNHRRKSRKTRTCEISGPQLRPQLAT